MLFELDKTFNSKIKFGDDTMILVKGSNKVFI